LHSAVANEVAMLLTDAATVDLIPRCRLQAQIAFAPFQDNGPQHLALRIHIFSSNDLSSIIETCGGPCRDLLFVCEFINKVISMFLVPQKHFNSPVQITPAQHLTTSIDIDGLMVIQPTVGI